MVVAMRRVDQLGAWHEANSKDWRLRSDRDVRQTKESRKNDFDNAIYDWLDSQLEEVA
jgi:hypothetical protein